MTKILNTMREYRKRPRGVSLRDYLAAHCPLTLEEFRARWPHTDAAQIDAWFAAARYRYADSMLRARGRDGGCR